jgi:hypothetical protein
VQAKELAISKLPASDLAGLATRLVGLLPFRGIFRLEGILISKTIGRTSPEAHPGWSTLSTARAPGVLECRKWCRRSHPKGTLRLAHVGHASAEPSSLFTIVAWSPWSLAVWLRDCDLCYAIYRKSIVLPNPSVGLLFYT